MLKALFRVPQSCQHVTGFLGGFRPSTPRKRATISQDARRLREGGLGPDGTTHVNRVRTMAAWSP